MKQRHLMAAMAAGAAWLGSVSASAQPLGVRGYELIEIRPLPGHSTTGVTGLDDFARVLGRSRGTPSTPIVWINGNAVVIPTPPDHSLPLVGEIGSGGVVTGTAIPDGSPYRRGIAWTLSNGIQPLDLLPGTLGGNPESVDDAPWPNTLLGGSCGTTVFYATLWHAGTPTQIGGARSAVHDVNNLGEAVGSAENEFQVPRPVLWRNGEMIDIGGEPRNVDGIALGMNDRTEVVGYLRVPFHWWNGVLTVLPVFHSCFVRPAAINNRGLIVGEENFDPQCRSGHEHAVAWEYDGEAFIQYDLNDYLPRHEGVLLREGVDVNNAGQIAAYGELFTGQGRGFLVTPYLFEMSDPVPGRAGTMNTLTVTGLQPNQRVHLVWGTREGAQKIRPACPGGTLLIRDPQALPAVRADANGIATISLNVPLIARGQTIRMQAVAPFECEISHTVTWTFE